MNKSIIFRAREEGERQRMLEMKNRYDLLMKINKLRAKEKHSLAPPIIPLTKDINVLKEFYLNKLELYFKSSIKDDVKKPSRKNDEVLDAKIKAKFSAYNSLDSSKICENLDGIQFKPQKHKTQAQTDNSNSIEDVNESANSKKKKKKKKRKPKASIPTILPPIHSQHIFEPKKNDWSNDKKGDKKYMLINDMYHVRYLRHRYAYD